MKISKLILELSIGYLMINALHKSDFDHLDNLIKEKLEELNPKILSIYNDVNYMYSIQNDVNFKPKELQRKISDVEKEIEKIDAESVVQNIFKSLK